jgi:arylformamidase
MTMAIYDISLTISADMPVWPGDPKVQLTQIAFIDQGEEANITYIAMGVHTGTHVDAPHHFLNDNKTVEYLSLDILTGPCYVTQLPDDVDAITAEALERTPIPDETKRLLFGTRNSHYWAQGEKIFQTDFVGITEDGARWLAEKGIKLVGMDYLSVAPYHQSRPTHVALLEAGIVIVEGLNLARIPRGFYDLYCLPLKIAASDGAPARTILVG